MNNSVNCNLILSEDISQAVQFLMAGKIIAYPTEGVYGLGCDPYNEQAVSRLIALKQRDRDKGLILLASHYEQIQDLISPLTEFQYQCLINETQKPITWLLPASEHALKWVTGKHSKIAIRLTTFPLAQSLCKLFNKPIVSTSANKSGQPPAKTSSKVMEYFNDEIDMILEGRVGSLNKPTELHDIVTGEILRK